MPVMSGKTLGKVQIGEMIARGGMAEVYLGEHITLDRKVAVKIMREFVDSDPDIKIRFEREARAVAGLRHPNIVQVFDFDVTDGQPFLIMEYVPGASLGVYLRALHKRGEKLPFNTISRILNALASAIDYAHKHNLIHRDIKPANVLLRSASGPIDIDKPLPEDVEPILTDFGLVRLLDSSIQTSTGTVSGTPAYMSPEQARGEKVDLKTDIYSLGVMLYEMLAGMVPFDAESTFGILMKHMNEPPPPIPGISSDLQAIIDRALAKDPAYRYESAAQLANEFINVFNGQTVSVNTLKLATLARENAIKADQPSQPLVRNLAVIGAFILIGLAFVAIRWFSPATQVIPIGQLSYSDINGHMDKSTLSFSNLAHPEPGTHYEAWYLAQGGETRLNIGAVKMGDGRQGELVFNDSNKKNLLGAFDQIEITIEPDNDPTPNESSGEIVASSIFPPLALIHVRHLDNSFGGAPNETALIQGLLSTAKSVDTSTQELQTAFNNNDEKLLQKKIEEIINQIVGSANTAQYKDWDSDGKKDDPSDGYGLLEGTIVASGDSGYDATNGYIPNTISHAQFAAQATDATENIRTNMTYVVISAQNIGGWSQQLVEKAIQLQGIPFGPGMKPVIDEILVLSGQMVYGTDSNKNKKIEPIIGEGGAETAYKYAYDMAMMPLLPGAHQLPPASLPSGN